MASVNVQNPLRGFHIYTDKKHRTIYYNPLTHKAMQIPGPEFKRFRMFQSRYVSVAAIFLLVLLIFYDWLHMPLWIPIVLGIVTLGIFEFLWYRFQNSLPPYKNFDKSRLISSYDQTISRADRQKAWIRIVLTALIGVLLVINAYMLHYDTGMLTACWIAMVALFVYAGFCIWQLSRASVR